MSKQHSTDGNAAGIDQVLEITNALAKISASANYIYRGEAQCYEKVSSSLYRAHPDKPDIEAVQETDLDEAALYTTETDRFAILTEIQHYGGKTNLIDFTTDYLIALFFACDGDHNQNGRVILLDTSGEMRDHIHRPQTPESRVRAQKSVFIRPSRGYVQPDQTIIIPSYLKSFILDYLNTGHDISTTTIYNDLLGFIRSQEIYREASEHFRTATTNMANGEYEAAIRECSIALNQSPQMATAYCVRGIANGNIRNYEQAIRDFTSAIDLIPEYAHAINDRGRIYRIRGQYGQAIQDYNRLIALNPFDANAHNDRGLCYHQTGDYERAIADYNSAIGIEPSNAITHGNLGEAWLHLGDWDNARTSLTMAQHMGSDIVASFHNDYENIADFERQTGLTVPDDLARMLGG